MFKSHPSNNLGKRTIRVLLTLVLTISMFLGVGLERGVPQAHAQEDAITEVVEEVVVEDNADNQLTHYAGLNLPVVNINGMRIPLQNIVGVAAAIGGFIAVLLIGLLSNPELSSEDPEDGEDPSDKNPIPLPTDAPEPTSTRNPIPLPTTEQWIPDPPPTTTPTLTETSKPTVTLEPTEPATEEPEPAPTTESTTTTTTTEAPYEHDVPVDLRTNSQGVTYNALAREGTPEEAGNLFGTVNGIITPGSVRYVNTSYIEEGKIVEGTILSIPPSPEAPDGLLVKVDLLQPFNEYQTMIRGVEAEITDIIPDSGGTIELYAEPGDTEYCDTVATGLTFTCMSKETEKELSFLKKSFETDISRNLGVDKALLTGDFELGAKMVLNTKLFRFEEISATLEADAHGELDLQHERSFEKTFEGSLIPTQKYTPKFMLPTTPPVPVYITIETGLGYEFNASAKGSFKYNPKFNASASFGPSYTKDDGFTIINKRTFDLEGEKLSDIKYSGNLNLDAGLVLSSEAKLYDTIGINGEVGTLAEFDASISDTSPLRCVFTGSVNPKLGFVADLPFVDPWKKDIFETRFVLYENDELCDFLNDEEQPTVTTTPTPTTSTTTVTVTAVPTTSTSTTRVTTTPVAPPPTTTAVQPTYTPQPTTTVAPPRDPSDVVPDQWLKLYINREFFNRNDEHPISREEMKQVRYISHHNTMSLEGIQYADNLQELKGTYWGDINATYIPDISHLKYLQTISLGTSGSSIPSSGGGFPALTSLRIVDSPNLESLPADIGNGGKLTEFKVLRSSIKSLPESTGNQSNLQKIVLEDLPYLRAVPESFAGSTRLTQLGLTNLPLLEKLPDGAGNWTSLQILALTNLPALRALPSTLGNMRSLTQLGVYETGLYSLPEGFGNLRSLTKADFKDNYQLEALSSDFGNLSSLVDLNLERSTNLRSLPSNFGNLSSLKSLKLRGCTSLAGYPASMSNLRTLESIDLSAMGLTSLPEFLLDIPAPLSVNFAQGNSIPSDDPVLLALRSR